MRTLPSVLLFSFVLFACLVAYCNPRNNHPPKNDWSSYKRYHGRKYEGRDDEKYHREIFKKKAAEVLRHNAKFVKGLVTFQKELNRFTDEDDVTLRLRLGFKHSNVWKNGSDVEGPTEARILRADPPASFDWRPKKAVSPVKDQGKSGSCWAFAATGALESQAYLKYKTMKPLSEEQLVDCDTNDGGCGGGDFKTAWTYIIKNKGIQFERDYPFVAGSGQSQDCQQQCAYTSSNGVQKMTSYKRLDKTEDELLKYLVSIGPLAVAFDGSGLHSYSSGIYTCPSDWKITHAVIIIGYGSDGSGNPYWILKNQWGADWGMNGYFYMARGSNACGVNSNVAYPII